MYYNISHGHGKYRFSDSRNKMLRKLVLFFVVFTLISINVVQTREDLLSSSYFSDSGTSSCFFCELGDSYYPISAQSPLVEEEVYAQDDPANYTINTLNFDLITLHTVNIDLNGTFNDGSNFTVIFYDYQDRQEANTTIWNFTTTPETVDQTFNVTHNKGIENSTLVLTNSSGDIIQTIKSFVVSRSSLMQRLAEIDLQWAYASPEERNTLFREIVDIDMQWPYAPVCFKVTIHVQYSNGNPIEDSLVKIYLGTGEFLEQGTTGPDGNYNTCLEDGEYLAKAWLPDNSQMKQTTFNVPDDKVVTIGF